MSAVPFDTLRLADKLEAAGFTHDQARAQAEVLIEVATADKTSVATKLDLAEAKAELIKWVVTVGILQMTLIGALLMKLSG